MLNSRLSSVSWLALLLSTAQLVYAIPRARPDPKLWLKDYQSYPGTTAFRRQTASNACNANFDNAITAPKPNVFRELSPPEVAGVAEWLFAQPDLNLTAAEDAGEWDNTIALIEVMPPNKTNVVAYLDGSAPEPPRYAHVVLEISSVVDAHYADIIVGPVPIDNATVSWSSLEYPYTKKAAGKVRNLLASDATQTTNWTNVITASIADITMFLFNGTAMGLPNDTILSWGNDPYWQDDGRITK